MTWTPFFIFLLNIRWLPLNTGHCRGPGAAAGSANNKKTTRFVRVCRAGSFDQPDRPDAGRVTRPRRKRALPRAPRSQREGSLWRQPGGWRANYRRPASRQQRLAHARQPPGPLHRRKTLTAGDWRRRSRLHATHRAALRSRRDVPIYLKRILESAYNLSVRQAR